MYVYFQQLLSFQLLKAATRRQNWTEMNSNMPVQCVSVALYEFLSWSRLRVVARPTCVGYT